MISKYTLNTLKYFLLVFEKVLLSPFTWTERDGFRIMKKNSFLFIIWRINTGVVILFRALFSLLHVFFISYLLTDGERFLAIYMLCMDQLTSQLHFAIFRDPERLAIMLDAFFTFNQRQGEKIRCVSSSHY